ncbi:glycosyl transferase family 1 [Tamlana nanhaiensis]|uniref:Glycosyl transferase family 1 n=1 Tax=Neotamlana nanhaiensis TaxID=1382798 RepID=A0A0D7W2U1_9FLAO|nr:glycosyltransferase [Tamlana nanhaiensis]KJD33406.1 glycosyl transferase family 1 [Tamlana nanhaiensis]
MKILMVSIPTLHFFRWADQLKYAGHEVFWFDITGMSAPVEKLNWVEQKVNWKLKYNYPGRIFLKKRFPKVYNFIQKFNEKNTASEFENYLNKVKPDVVHSFAIYLSCAPILEVMTKYNQKWIYSSWGSDLYYFQNKSQYLNDIKRVLPRINYLFTDCNRDYIIAKKHGFSGDFLGVFPGGGGFNLQHVKSFCLPIEKRKTILIKGFQGRSGRAITVLKAINNLQKQLQAYKIIVFGAPNEVFQFVQNSALKDWENLEVLGRINHEKVLEIMGEALVYVGNSNSDGMPNTLLEAIIMGAFPIQSNPGNATSELITHNKNGLLINNCENEVEIEALITSVLRNTDLLEEAYQFNQNNLKPNLDREVIKRKVLEKYASIGKQ